MHAMQTDTVIFTALGRLLEYPAEDFQESLEEALHCARETSPCVAECIEAFWADAARLSAENARELYTRSFDLAPVCVPYVSVHVFGAESFKRAELMTGLKAAYERAGCDCGSELPDHIASVLQLGPRLEPEEWADLSTLVIAPAADKMHAALEGANSPWRHVMRAVRKAFEVGDATHGE
ncbi:MAG: nitrate reductase molybdenum cofactor assembly chaperone [Candidatus Hydrogenedentes bacterium]|nr:nitrate reductase molybdenum cofactor assembly chaperone [Candidatus Hydrogenedentota bacterium]